MEVITTPRTVGVLGVGLAGERAAIALRAHFSARVACHTWSTHATQERISQTLQSSLGQADVVVLVVDGSLDPANLRQCLAAVLDRARLINTVVLSKDATAPNALANTAMLRPVSSMLTITRDESYLDAMLQALGIR
jgi:hypothetical protein